MGGRQLAKGEQKRLQKGYRAERVNFPFENSRRELLSKVKQVGDAKGQQLGRNIRSRN